MRPEAQPLSLSRKLSVPLLSVEAAPAGLATATYEAVVGVRLVITCVNEPLTRPVAVVAVAVTTVPSVTAPFSWLTRVVMVAGNAVCAVDLYWTAAHVVLAASL